jgi:hypothetical protein
LIDPDGIGSALHEYSILPGSAEEQEIRERINNKLSREWVGEGHGFSRAAQG